MAVHIRLIKNNIKSSSSYGKYFAKAVSQGEVTLDEIAAEACRMQGKTFKENPYIGRDDLRHVRALHWDYDNQMHVGEMVCNQLIADRLVRILRQLFDAKYPIQRMLLRPFVGLPLQDYPRRSLLQTLHRRRLRVGWRLDQPQGLSAF